MGVCVMTLLTDKAAQVINQWGNCLKFMGRHRIYKMIGTFENSCDF